MKKKIYKISLLALFLSIMIVLNIFENFLPIIIPIPGVRLGIANSISLIVLYYFNKKEYIFLNFLRIFLVSILYSGLFSISFFLSLSGFISSCIIVLILSINKKVSIYTLSIGSAIFHSIGQTLCASVLYSSFYIMVYLSVLIITSIITGYVIALLSSIIIKRLEKIIIKSL